MNFKSKKIIYHQNILLKYNFYIYIFILIISTSCTTEEKLILTNTTSDNRTNGNSLNLRSLDSGQNLESVTINWNPADYISTAIDNQNIIPPHSIINLNAGQFYTINLDLETYENNLSKDSIQIFTRAVHPVTNFSFEINEELRGNLVYDEGEIWTDLDSNNTWDPGEDFIDKEYIHYHRLLSWTPTVESDDNFEKYIIYRSDDPSLLINTEDCDCNIAQIISKPDSTYIDSTIDVIEEQNMKKNYYRVQVVSKNSYRNSYIYNYTNFNSPGKIQLNNTDNTAYNGYIIINWEPIINVNLNHYEIWRSRDKEGTDPHLITTILNRINPTLDYFMDRNVGNGSTWFYSLATININGTKKFSDYIEKWSKP